MPTQTEEVKLVLSLVDNASPGIEKLKSSVSGLGQGASVRNLERFSKETEAIQKVLGQFSKTAEEAFRAFGAFRGGMVAGAGGLVLFGYELGKQLKDLGEYTDKLRHIGQLGRAIGVDPGVIKNIADQLGVFNVTADQAEAGISKFVTRLSEIQRDPRIRSQILQDVASGTREAMEQQIEGILRAETVEDKLNRARELQETIRRNYKKQDLNAEQAAERTRTLMARLGYDEQLGLAGELKKRSAEQIEADKSRFDNADAYSRKLGTIRLQLEEIKGLLIDPMIAKNSWLFFLTEKLSDALGKLQRFEEHGGLPGLFKRRLGIPDEEASPKLEKHSESLDENTKELKRLTDLLQTPGGDGGGIMLAGLGGISSGRAPGRAGFGGGGYTLLPEGTGEGTVPRAMRGGGGGGRGGPRASGPDPTTSGGSDYMPAEGGRIDPALERDRSNRFAEELKAKPWLARRIMQIGLGENRDPRANQAAMEEIFNRASSRGTTLEQETKSVSQGGYYPGTTFSGGAGGLQSAKARAMAEANFAAVLAGGNLSNYATDNSSIGLAYSERYGGAHGRYGRPGQPPGKFTFQSEYGGRGGTGSPGMETYFSPGWGGSGRASRARWQAWRKSLDETREAIAADRFKDWPDRQLESSRGALDRSSATKVQGSAKVKVDVGNADLVEGQESLFRPVPMHQQRQMYPAQSGPVEDHPL